MNHDDNKQSLNPASLPLADAARLLTKMGGRAVTVQMIEADLAAGVTFPPKTNPASECYSDWIKGGAGHEGKACFGRADRQQVAAG